MLQKIYWIFIFMWQITAFQVSGERMEFAHFNDELELVALFLPPHPVILEAGAHYGEDTCRMQARWPASTIHAFEPFPLAFSTLEQATAHLPNVFRYPFALHDRSGQFIFYVCGMNDGASSLLAPQEYTKEAYQGPLIQVEAQNLGEWASAHQVTHIDFMWLDMEGAELPVLKSAGPIFQTVKAIFIETNFWECRVGTTQYGDLKNFLNAEGFEEIRHWIGPGQGNAIFVRKALLSRSPPTFAPYLLNST